MPFALSLTFIIRHRSSYLTGTLGAAVHNPVLLILKETAVLPAHALVFDVLHVPQHLLHHSVLLSLTDRCTARQMDKRSRWQYFCQCLPHVDKAHFYIAGELRSWPLRTGSSALEILDDLLIVTS